MIYSLCLREQNNKINGSFIDNVEKMEWFLLMERRVQCQLLSINNSSKRNSNCVLIDKIQKINTKCRK